MAIYIIITNTFILQKEDIRLNLYISEYVSIMLQIWLDIQMDIEAINIIEIKQL